MLFKRWMLAIGMTLTILWVGTTGSTSAAYAPETSPTATVFVENVGQFPSDVRFQAQTTQGTLWLTDEALWWMHVNAESKRAVALRLTFTEGDTLRFSPLHRAQGHVNYYLGDRATWRTDVPLWQAVRIDGVAPDAALELDGRGGELTWRLSGGEDAVALHVEGGDALTATDAGLRIETALGALQLPLAATAVDDQAVRLRALPRSRPSSVSATATSPGLFGTYLGGSSGDDASDLALGSDGSVYVTGYTLSTDFPRTSGPTTLSGRTDAFVTRLAADGGSLLYSTYLGGSYSDEEYYNDEELSNGIAVDADGYAYIVGTTCSDDFPVTPGAYDESYNGPTISVRRYEDAFVSKLTPTGALAYSTYLGGSGRMLDGALHFGDSGWDIALHNGRVYVVGNTNSEDFPTTTNAYDRTYASNYTNLQDAFLTVLNPAGSGASDLVYSTFLGNNTSTTAFAVTVDSTGIAYLTGLTFYSEYDDDSYDDFPTTPGAYAPTRDHSVADNEDSGFFAKINPAGGGASDLLYSTYLDGSSGDVGYGIALDATGMAYIIGGTGSPDFPTTPDAYDTTCGPDGNCDSADTFIMQLRPNGQGSADLRYSTFLGGSSHEGDLYAPNREFGAIALSPNGDVLVTGLTGSSDFPVTADAQSGFRNGIEDAYVSRLRLQSQGADDLVYSTYLGGALGEEGHGIAAPDNQTVCLAGNTSSANFPTTPGAYDTSLGGYSDAFVTCLAAPPRPDLASSTKTVAPEEAVVGEVVTFTVRLANAGALDASAHVTDTLPAALLFHGTPSASAGSAPSVNGQTLTWAGAVIAGETVTLTYATELTATTEITPTATNQAHIDDGAGNVYTRWAFVNGSKIYLPLVVRQ
jgi:uncharacterized repeat protein (TIGR01451 family)